jgi:hypothetical protein
MTEQELVRLLHAYGPWGALAIIILGGGPISQAIFGWIRKRIGDSEKVKAVGPPEELALLRSIDARVPALEGKPKDADHA